MLMPVNWLIEAVKWRSCISGLERVSVWLSFRAVLSGVSVSLFMPNRIGEYLGRVFVLKNADRIEAALSTMVAAFSQLLVTLLAGSIAVVFYGNGWIGTSFSMAIASLLSVLSLIVYYRSSHLGKLVSNWKLPETWKSRLDSISAFSLKKLSLLLFYSFVRYIVFALQFLLMLRFFTVWIPVHETLLCISVTYLIMAVVPTIALTELGVRGAVAAVVFAPFTGSVEQVVFASSVLWLINLVLPALTGSLFISRWRLVRTW